MGIDIVDPGTGEKKGELGQQENSFDALDKAGEIELPKFDPTPFIGKESFIEQIEERVGQYGFYIVIKSQPVDEGRLQIRASRMFGLQQDEKKEWGWGPKTQLGLFLKKHNVDNYKKLLGNPKVETLKDKEGVTYRLITGETITKVIIQTRQSKKEDGQEFLSF